MFVEELFRQLGKYLEPLQQEDAKIARLVWEKKCLGSEHKKPDLRKNKDCEFQQLSLALKKETFHINYQMNR